MHSITRILILICPFLLARPAAGQDLDNSELDSRFQEDQRIVAGTALGNISVGVFGIREDAKRDATRGDLEVGTFYQHEFDTVFPRIVELRPFIFNRIDSTYDSTYTSRGLGVGTRVSMRKKNQENNWFVRLSVLTTTEEYREIYGGDRDNQSIVELFAGFEFVLADATPRQVIRNRLTTPDMIELSVPDRLINDNAIPPDLVREVHTLIIAAYLARVRGRIDEPLPMHDPHTRRYPTLTLVEHATGKQMTLDQRIGLVPQRLAIPEQDLARRREIVHTFLQRGLATMMRNDYPLLILIASPNVDTPSNATAPTHAARMSRPGMNLRPRNTPLDADTMIRDFIASYCEQMR